MRNLPPNLEATHIYTARLSESGARSVKIIIRSLETSSSSAQAAVAALPCRWLCLLNQRFTSAGLFTRPFLLENNCHNKCDVTQWLCVLKLIYANNAYLVNASKIRHPLGICTAMNTVINVRALRCRDFIASSP